MTLTAIPPPDAVGIVRGLLAERYPTEEFDVELELDHVVVRWDTRRSPKISEFHVRETIRLVERTAA